MNIGWFRVSRKLFDNEIWFLEPFTKGQAWIDLVGNANHKDGQFEIRGNLITIKRGQIGWSEVTMAKRWKWSRNKVRRYLKWLETIQQIEQQKDRYLTTIITIKNYDKYQNDTADDTAERQQTIQQTIHKQERYKNDKNDKNTIKKEKVKKLYNEKWTLEEVGKMVVEAFNLYLGTKFKDTRSFLNGLEYWLETYTPEDIETAISKIKYSYWKGKMTPVIMFRRKNPQGEPVDYISQLLNYSKEIR